jgi:hypothetical protein
MTIDNCTRCDMCSHKNVCKKASAYTELITRTVDSLTDKYDAPIEDVLKGMNACITLTCLDYVREVKVREL